MKQIILMMMCLAIAMTSYSAKVKDKLEVSGYYLDKSNVKFEVAIVNNDASRVIVQTKSSIFSYRIQLKIGNEYVITFTKDGVTKELYVTADGPGLMEVDVDFKSDSAAQVCYNKTKDRYNLTLLYKRQYE
jgi:hypothetical protein